MEKERRVKILSVVALVVAVLGLTIAFAALSKTLTINGTATINKATWDIHFDADSFAKDKFSTGTINSIAEDGIQISGTQITGIKASVSKPGDKAWFTINIVNGGNINADLTQVDVSKLCTLDSSTGCDWDGDNDVDADDIAKVNANVTFRVYEGTTDLKAVRNLPSASGSNVLPIKVELEYLASSTELPAKDLTFDDLAVTLLFAQAADSAN